MALFKRFSSSPRLSIIVIVYSMPRQALNTVYSLSPVYQQKVDKSDYEIIVVENRSQNNMDETALGALSGNIRYYLRDESLPTPVNAINFGVDHAKAKNVCILVDGD